MENYKITMEFVDLGLPSGTLWAKTNIGAEKETDHGKRFMWGELDEVTPGENGRKACMNTYFDPTFKKYVVEFDPTFKKCDIDKNIILNDEDDIATQIIICKNFPEKKVHIPTAEQLEELSKLSNKWVTKNGVNGRIFKGLNGSTLFLPVTGYQYGDYVYNEDDIGYYMSSNAESYGQCLAMNFGNDDHSFFDIYEDDSYITNVDRTFGFAIRPVIDSVKNVSSESKNNKIDDFEKYYAELEKAAKEKQEKEEYNLYLKLKEKYGNI